MEERAGFRCGFVSLLGRPNVGKSTLINAILGRKIAITTPKPQTTRNRIMGVHNTPEAQLILVDTPGLHKGRGELNRVMARQARQAAQECDLAAMIIEAHRPWLDQDIMALDLVEGLSAPAVLVINKVDLVPKERVLPLIDHSAQLGVFEEIVPISALKNENVDRLVRAVAGLLPESGPLYPEEVLTDRAERFFAAEAVREKVILFTRQELPYSTGVIVEEFKEEPSLLRIRAAVLVDRPAHKPIVIGKGGAMLKKIGTSARKDLERFFGRKVFLELVVRVEKKWWQNPDTARQMGLDQ